MGEISLPTIDEIADKLTFLKDMDITVDRNGHVWVDKYSKVWFSVFYDSESSSFGMEWERMQRRLGEKDA